MTRVLVVTNDYPPASGGIQRYLEGLLPELPWEIRVAAPAHPDAAPDPDVMRFRGPLVPTPAAAEWVIEQIGGSDPHVVLFGAFPLGLIGPRVAAATGVPYALLLHGAEIVVPGRIPILVGRYRRALAAAKVRAAVSRYTQDVVRRRMGVGVAWIGGGVDPERFSPGVEPHDGFVVGSVGRFVARKGQHRVVCAAHRLRQSGVDARVLLVGWGPGEGKLRRLADRLDVPTEFQIGVPDPAPLYRRMDVFAMPVRSRWFGLEVEGLGLVYLEAAAAGLPVIAGPSGGAPETVEEGVTGYVVDGLGDLVDRLSTLAGDERLRSSMGAAGRARIEHEWTWKAVADRLQAVVEESLHA